MKYGSEKEKKTAHGSPLHLVFHQIFTQAAREGRQNGALASIINLEGGGSVLVVGGGMILWHLKVWITCVCGAGGDALYTPVSRCPCMILFNPTLTFTPLFL